MSEIGNPAKPESDAHAVHVDPVHLDSVHLDKIGQIAITVRDLARAKDFYQNTLGMKFLFDAGSMVFFQCGDIRLLIGPSPEPVSGGTILYFKVPDIHAAHAELARRGAAFMHAPQMVAKMQDHDLWIAVLTDPDGNHLALMSEAPHAT